jgi:hypothetical protein
MDELGFVTWKLVQLVLWAGPFWLALLLAAWSAFCVFVGFELEAKLNAWSDTAPKPLEPTQALRDHFSNQVKADKPMGAAKLDHIKYDILPDGTLGPGDNRGLEGPE